MVGTLQAMPEIDSVKSSVARYGGMPQAMVQYRDLSKAGQGATIRFQARGLEAPYQFQTMMGGLSTPRTPPNDFGVRRIEGAWKTRCNVKAMTLFI